MVWLPKNFESVRDMSRMPPGLAADVAFRLFCLPSFSDWRPKEHDRLAQRARYYLRSARWQTIATPLGRLRCYVFTPDEGDPLGTVLMVHGWTGEASFMTALGEAVRRAGYRVVLFDLPAHGMSEGRSTNLIDCARAVIFVADVFGPFEAVLSHSFGGMITMVAAEGLAPMPHGMDALKYVLVASPNRLTDITTAFCKARGMTNEGRRAFEQRLERIGRRPIEFFSVGRLLGTTNRSALVIHDTHDDAVPFARCKEIVDGVPLATPKTFDGLGHRKILFASQVARTIISFLRH